ncbi:DUF1801 domain-containing protein [Rhizobium sp. TH2]|uniref:DUF1801 domain-containing protein n=1 Tax=Rhizobium sp. TH2 TaxID=2775403 RepID=UPI0021575224|nr:DUF1801 domain-containing protein [Rhizobium sp. TH2]UVC10301.1 DUF1801 domain-containing protein [Rhizobium sp. TH2]
MRSTSTTVEDYLAELAPTRREALERVRAIILENLPEGYEESMNWGMIVYEVPLAIQPKTYNGQPLMLAALASQKNHMAVYLCGLYCGVPGVKESFERRYRENELKLDMGAACVRFKSLDKLDLDAVAEAIRSVPVTDFVKASARKRGT